MYCRNCGKMIDNGDRFCGACGTDAYGKPGNTVNNFQPAPAYFQPGYTQPGARVSQPYYGKDQVMRLVVLAVNLLLAVMPFLDLVSYFNSDWCFNAGMNLFELADTADDNYVTIIMAFLAIPAAIFLFMSLFLVNKGFPEPDAAIKVCYWNAAKFASVLLLAADITPLTQLTRRLHPSVFIYIIIALGLFNPIVAFICEKPFRDYKRSLRR